MVVSALRAPSLPPRSPARTIEEVGRGVRPLVLARDRSVALAEGGLGALVPGGVVERGTVLRVTGAAGAGATTTAFELAAAFTGLGEWVAAVDLDGSLGALAARDAGVELERFAVVRRVPPARWATVVGALLDATSLVIAETPRHANAGDARRLVARARERESVLVALERGAARWPADARLELCAEASAWEGLGDAAGYLTGRRVHVRVEGRGAAARPRVGDLARAV